MLSQASAVLLCIPLSLHGVFDGLREGFYGVAGWLWPAFGVVAISKGQAFEDIEKLKPCWLTPRVW